MSNWCPEDYNEFNMKERATLTFSLLKKGKVRKSKQKEIVMEDAKEIWRNRVKKGKDAKKEE